jgi:uncharacterized membrane protein YfcA
MSDAVVIVTVMAAGALSGGFGAVLGIGGGAFLVPFLTLVVGLPFREAAGISLTTVIATSSAVAGTTAGQGLINLRLGMLLEVATAAGGLAGGLTAQMLPERVLQALFGGVTTLIAAIMLGQLRRSNVILDESIDPGRLGGRYYDEGRGRAVLYRVRRLPIAMVASFLAGNVSSLLGIGGGILKVPVLTAWCGVPIRAAAATSALMIGVTALAAAPIYYAHGEIAPHLGAAAVLGVLLGSRAGFRFSARAPAKWLKLALAVTLLLVSAVMFARLK